MTLTPFAVHVVIHRDPLVVSKDTPIIEAIARMSGQNSPATNHADSLASTPQSCCIVVENNYPIGIFTERDVVRLLQRAPVPESWVMQDVMTQPVITYPEADCTDLFAILNLLQSKKIRHLPIVDAQQQLVGLVTYDSLRQAVRPADLLRLRLVREVMTTSVVTAVASDPVLAIAAQMTTHQISSVVVVPDADSSAAASAIGIITERDIVRICALGGVSPTQPVQSIMRAPVISVSPDTSLWTAQQIMDTNQIRRLVVVDKSQDTGATILCGILTQSNLLHALNPLELYRLTEVLEQRVAQLEAENCNLMESRAAALEQEIARRTAALKAQADHQRLITTIATQIRSSLDLQEILQTTVATLQSLLQCDRVTVWQFDADWNCQVVAEATQSSRSLLGEQFHDTCIREQDVLMMSPDYARVVTDIYMIPMTDCHRQVLMRLGIRAKILVPLVCGDSHRNGTGSRLWGLLQASESNHSREWQPSEVNLMRDLAVQLAIALQHATVHQQLQESEHRYASLAAAAPVGIFRTDADGRCTYVNDRWCVIAGLSHGEAMGDGWYQGLHPEDRQNVTAEWTDALQENRPFRLEYRFQRPDGGVSWVYGQAIAQWDANGQLLGHIGTITDISDRKQAEMALADLNADLEQRVLQRTAELQERETRYRALMDGASDAILISDLHGNLLEANVKAEQLLGYTRAELTQMHYTQLHQPDELATVVPMFQQLATQDRTTVLNVNFCSKTGEIVPMDITASVIDIHGEKILQAILRDIRDRQHAEAALRVSETRFRRVFDSNVVGMMFTDFSGKITDANDRFLSMIGYTRTELESGQVNWAEITPPDYVEQDVAAIAHLRAHGSIDPWEKAYRHKDGHLVPVLIGVAMLSQVDGSCVCVIVDISDRKRTEQTIAAQMNREALLWEITQRIRQSLDLQNIFDTACSEIRDVLEADRVGIFKFYPGSNYDDGEFVAESVVEGFPSVVGICVHDHCFGSTYSALYAQGRYYVVNDIYANRTENCHVDILARFKVRANLVMPLLCGEKLWGLLCIHQCRGARQWQPEEVAVGHQLANQLAIAIQQALLYDQIQSELLVRQQAEAQIAQQLRQQTTLGAIIQQIRESLNLTEILGTVTQQVKDILQGDRVIVFRIFPDGRSKIVEESVSSPFPSLKDRQWDDEVWSQDILDCYWQGKPRIVPDVMQDIWTDCLMDYSLEGKIQSKIVAPILQDVKDCESHRWVAQNQSNKLWGILVVHACQEKRVWQESEAQLLQQIANQFAIAIQQADLFQQLQQELNERLQTQQLLTQRNQQLAASNDELERVTRLKDEFLANMSHELRTPLNAILGMAEGLQDEIFGELNSDQQKALSTIERSGSHLLELINDILDLAKIESGQMELELSCTAIAPLCRASLAFVKQQAFKKQIQLETNIPPNLPELLLDERRMRQVLINLLNNAVKFTPAGGRISLTIQLQPSSHSNNNPQHHLRIAVSDTGIGISAGDRDKLFQPFVQIDSALNRQYQGTGLGLSLVKRIVEMHGGQVDLTSEVGVGSCFTIELPYVPAVPGAEGPACGLEETPHVEQAPVAIAPLILLAEDNEANISTISSYLQVKGYRLIVARDGASAVAIAQAEHPSLILMDIQMPGMDGLEAMQKIRLDPQLAHVPMIALTALAMENDRDRCLAAGASDYLSKPLKLKQLANLIQQRLHSES